MSSPSPTAASPAAAAADHAAPDRSLSAVVRELNESLEFERVVGLVARHARRLLGAGQASVLTVDGPDFVVVGSAGDAAPPVGTRIPAHDTFSGATLRAGHPLRTADGRAEAARWPRSAAALAPGLAGNAVAAPLLAGRRAIGVVCVFSRPERDFDEEDERVLAELADHAAVATENARLFTAAARTARHAHILATSARELAHHVTPAALYAGLTDVATTMLGACRVTVLLADPETRHVELAHAGAATDGGSARTPPAGDDDGLRRGFWHGALGEAVVAGRPRFLDADAVAAASDDALAGGGTRGAALLPLVVEGQTRGLLLLRFANAPRFGDEERRLLADFATQVAVALRNARLVAALERRAARLAAVAHVQQALSQTRLADVYAELHRVVRSVVDVSGFAIVLRDGADDACHPCHVVVEECELPPASLGPCPQRAALDAAACAHGEPVLDRHPLWSLAAAAPPEPGRDWRPAASGMAAPIVHGARVLGVLHVQSCRPGAYDDEDADLVGLIARQAGAAVELAHRFDAQRHERELAEAAAAVARVALGAAGVREAAGAVLAAVAPLVPRLSLTLAVRVDDGAVLEYVAATPTLVDVVGHRVPFENSFARHLVADELTHLPDVRLATPPERRHIAPALGAVLVPLVARGRTLGLIAVETALDTPPSAATEATLRRIAAPVALAVDALLRGEEERRVADQLRQHEKLAALGSLVAGVAHELNNPLTGISAFSQLLLEEPLPDDQLESVRLIKRESDRAVAVIRDLLLFARKTDARLEAVDVNALLELTVRLRAYTHRAEGITVALDLDPDAPRVPADEQRLQQVLLNLIVNAEHALQGRAERRLALRTRRAADQLVVEVGDTGSGIAHEVQPHIFEPFFTTKPAGAGTGLGLSVSYGIVQAHGGTITVRSRPGHGTTFRITLPSSSVPRLASA